jgi:phosphoribosyl-AMP cyclohydrolase
VREGFKVANPKFDITSLKFNDQGLIPAIAQDHRTGEVLMMAWMNADAITRTLDSGQVTYWSRSRQSFWIKGESSGHRQALIELCIDCDRDAILVKIEQTGPACHTHRRSCFYTSVQEGHEVELMAPMT